MAEEIKTVEIVEPVKTESALPTREEARTAGMTADELDRAEKKGIIAKEAAPVDKAKQDAEAKSKADAEAKAKADAEAAEKAKGGEKPKVSFLDEMDKELTPEQEKALLVAFPPGTKTRAFYFRAKNERRTRQLVEAKNRELETRLVAIEQERKKPDPEKDEAGNVIDPDDQPLTVKQLKALQQAEAEKYQKQQAEQQEHAAVVAEAQTFQEEYARSVIPDFDDTVKMAMEVMQNLETMIPEKWKQAKAIQLIRDLQKAAATADKLAVDDYNAAMIGYEIGQMHPDYGKKAATVANTDTNGKSKDPKANGGLTPEQMKRIEENTHKRGSSASIPGGGGKRTVNVDDVTAADLNAMNYKERAAFKAQHPDRYLKLVRG